MNILEIDLNLAIIRVMIAFAIIIFGLITGRLIKKFLKKIIDRLSLLKTIKPTFVSLILVIVELSVYIIFVLIALNRLAIPALTDSIYHILIVIPAFTASIVIVSVGFVLAVYLRDIIKESEVKEGGFFSLFIFYFILFVFSVYAIKLALISLNSITTDYLIILLTAIISISVAYQIVKKDLRKD